MKFGPDVGQLAKGGSDPVKVVKDFLPLIRHVHLKDWNGGSHWAEYCPLGQGKVDLPAVLDLLEQSQDMKIIMVELDPSAKAPLTPIETARVSKILVRDLFIANLAFTAGIERQRTDTHHAIFSGGAARAASIDRDAQNVGI